VLVTFNSSVNFFVYCICSRDFRSIVARMFADCCFSFCFGCRRRRRQPLRQQPPPAARPINYIAANCDMPQRFPIGISRPYGEQALRRLCHPTLRHQLNCDELRIIWAATRRDAVDASKMTTALAVVGQLDC
jgi:hypothetical protein